MNLPGAKFISNGLFNSINEILIKTKIAHRGNTKKYEKGIFYLFSIKVDTRIFFFNFLGDVAKRSLNSTVIRQRFFNP